MIKRYLLLCLFLFPILLFSQNNYISIKGRVLNEFKTPISFATIKLLDFHNSLILKFAFSDTAGDYSLVDINKSDSLKIEITSLGYHSIIKTIYIHNYINILNFEMQRNNSQLPSVKVSSYINFKQKKDTTTFFTENYRISDKEKLGFMLKNIPGFEINEIGNIIFNGKIITKILVDNEEFSQNNLSVITNNLTALNIKSLDIIDNYFNQFDYSKKNELIGETVLNLNINKNRSQFFMGSSSFSEDFSLKKYEFKFDELSLLKRTKIFTVGNSNNVGLLANNISGSNKNTYQELDNIKFEPLINISNNVTNKYINELYYNNNNSKLLNTYISYKYNDIINSRSSISWERDRNVLSQKIDKFYNFNFTNINTSELTNLSKEVNQFDFRDETILHINKKLQSVFQAKINLKTELAINTDTSILINLHKSELNTVKNLYTFKLFNTYVFSNSTLINTSISYEKKSAPQRYNTQPFYIDTFDINKSYFNEHVNINTYTVLVFNSEIKSNFGFGTIRLGYDNMRLKHSLNTNMISISDLNTLSKNIDNKIYYDNDINTIYLNYSKNVTKFLTFTTDFKLNINEIRLNDTIIDLKIFRNKTKLLPTYNLIYNINDKSKIYINYFSNLISPNLYDNISGNSFIDNKNIRIGTSDNIGFPSSKNFNINFNHIDLIEKKLILSAGYINNNNNELYLKNIIGFNYFIFSTMVYMPHQEKTNMYYARFEKLLPYINSKYVLKFTLFDKSGTFINNNVYINNVISGASLDYNYNYSLKKLFYFDFKGNISHNRSTNNNMYNQNIDLYNSLNLKYYLNKSVSFEYNFDYFSNQAKSKVNNFNLSNFNFEYTPLKSNLFFTFNVRNIFDNKHITAFSQQLSESSINYLNLNNRKFILEISFNF